DGVDTNQDERVGALSADGFGVPELALLTSRESGSGVASEDEEVTDVLSALLLDVRQAVPRASRPDLDLDDRGFHVADRRDGKPRPGGEPQARDHGEEQERPARSRMPGSGGNAG